MMRGLVLVLLFGCGGMAPQGVTPTFRAEDPKLAPYVEAMTTRLARATGRDDIRCEPEGEIPVRYQDDLISFDAKGKPIEDCARTVWSKLDGIYVAAVVLIDPTPADGCSALPAVMLHEGFHALDPDAPHTNEPSVFDESASVSRVTMPALEALCSGFDCFAMREE